VRTVRGAWCVVAAVLVGAPLRTGEYHAPRPTHDQVTLEYRVHDLVNRYRRSRGLPDLGMNLEMARVAREHSRTMASGRESLGHQGFVERSREIGQTIRYTAMAENVALNDYPESATADTAVAGWLRSRGHRENIEGEYDLTGVGVVRDGRGTYFYTQIFLKR
jgi:uncharacterized protein YkwD